MDFPSIDEKFLLCFLIHVGLWVRQACKLQYYRFWNNEIATELSQIFSWYLFESNNEIMRTRSYQWISLILTGTLIFLILVIFSNCWNEVWKKKSQVQRGKEAEKNRQFIQHLLWENSSDPILHLTSGSQSWELFCCLESTEGETVLYTCWVSFRRHVSCLRNNFVVVPSCPCLALPSLAFPVCNNKDLKDE